MSKRKEYKRVYIEREGKYYIAHFAAFGIVSQGKTKKEAENNLIEAVGLFVITFLEHNSMEIFIDHLREF